MNLILFDTSDFISEACIELSGRRFEHIAKIHRASIGDTLRIGKINGLMGMGLITQLTNQSVTLKIQLTDEPPAALPLTLFLALPRPKFLTRIYQTVTSLGVKDIYLFNSYKVEKVYWSCEQLREEFIRENCLLGLEQSRDTVLPRVHLRRLFKPFVEDELPSIIQGTKALIAHPTATELCPRGIEIPVSLAIGPEGGFIDYEVEKLAEAGFTPVKLTERILKVETAITTLIGRIT